MDSIESTVSPISSDVDDRSWVANAVKAIYADVQRSSDTHMIRLILPGFDKQPLYLKDESTHPSGSLKHRLARSLFLYGLCNGQVTRHTPIVEASSGSTAISEAYFAKLIGLPFYAVVPKTTSPEKLALIEFQGGKCVKVEASEIYAEAARLAGELGGHYMDQFTYAERVTDWRGNNNIAESLFRQMEFEERSIPSWVVVSAGTGGTSATIGRYIRFRPELFEQTRLCIVDPENSVFYDYFAAGEAGLTLDRGSRIEGIGRPRVEPSFQRTVVDRMLRIPDAASIATVWWLKGILGRRCGGSTGTNVYGAIHLMQEMRDSDVEGSVVTMICDSGDRYAHTYFNREWLDEREIDIDPYLRRLHAAI